MRKRLSKAIISICVAIATVFSLFACTGVLDPLNNTEVFDMAECSEWLSGENLVAGQYEEIEVGTLKTGLEPKRVADIRVWFSRSRTLNYEFGVIRLTIAASRDVSMKVTAISGRGKVADYDTVLAEREVTLVKDEAKMVELDFTENVFIRASSSPDYITLSIRSNKELGPEDLESWLATDFTITAFEIYGGESSV